MRLSRHWTKRGLIVGAVVACVAGGTATALATEGSTPAGTPSAAPNSSPPVVQAPHFATNARGETYGSSLNTIPSDAPNLVSATGHNAAGDIVSGYVRSTDLNAASGANVKTPAQAAAYDANAETAGPVNIPLYAVDGTTVIGTFTVTPPGSAAPPAATSALAKQASRGQ